MKYVRVSSKYQIVIPKEIREGLHLKPGQRVTITGKDGIISLTPEISMKELKERKKRANATNRRHKQGCHT